MRFFKYEIAISFGSEDLKIARKIAVALKKKNIRIYFYPEENNVGKNLKVLTPKIFKEEALFVLAVISKNHIRGKWTSEEMEVVQTQYDKCGLPYLLPLRVDDTRIDGLSSNVVYLEWKGNNENEISEIVVERIKKFRRRIFKEKTKQIKKWGSAVIGICIILAIVYTKNKSPDLKENIPLIVNKVSVQSDDLINDTNNIEETHFGQEIALFNGTKRDSCISQDNSELNNFELKKEEESPKNKYKTGKLPPKKKEEGSTPKEFKVLLTDKNNYKPLDGVIIFMDNDSVGITNNFGILNFKKTIKNGQARSLFSFILKDKRMFPYELPYNSNEHFSIHEAL